MTELLSRRPRPRAPRRMTAGPPTRPARPVTVVGVLAALRAAGLGVLAVMVIVLVGWASAADSAASAPNAVAAGLQVWLVGHHARLVVPGGELTLVPLGLTALLLVLLHVATLRAGWSAGVTGRRGVVALTSAVTATYAVVATAVALLARTPEVGPLPLSAFAGAAAVAAVASGTGAVRATGRWPVLWGRVPALVRLALPPALGALAVLVAGSALLVGTALAMHHGRSASLVGIIDPGVGGAPLLLLGSLLYVPTAVVWGTAYVVGPGFSVGAGTTVTPFGGDLGPVPAFPLLAALPEGPSAGAGAGSLGIVVPVAAGVLAALLLHRALSRPGAPEVAGRRAVLGLAAVVGSAVGAATAVLALLGSGSAGPGRMAEVGPVWWAVGPLAGLEVAVVVAAALSVPRRRS